MPRLSIIIPHRHDDQRLEDTVLSVLENRPADCEVIIVHDGTYPDPYSLGDEVVFVDTEPNAGVIQMINAGAMAACAPIVNTLLDGVIVSEAWSEGPVAKMESQPEVASVAVVIERDGRRTCGIDADSIDDIEQLLIGRIEQATICDSCSAPEIACGFYRKSVLLALDGFLRRETCTAELDLSYALRQLKLKSGCDTSTLVHDCNRRQIRSVTIRRLARLAVKAGVVRGGWISALQALPAALLHNPMAAYNWCVGIATTRNLVRNRRIERARRQLAGRKNQDRLRLFVSSTSRRAA